MDFAQDWLSVIDTFIALSGWIITVIIAIRINGKLDSERTLKNHFIDEVKEIRDYEESIFRYVIDNSIKPQRLKSMMGNLNTRVSDLMSLLENQYNIQNGFLNAFQWKYSQIISDDDDYTNNFREDREFSFNHNLIKNYTNYRVDKLRLFNDLIVNINKAKSVRRG